MRSRYLLLIILLSALSPAFAQRSHSSHSSKDSPDKTVHVHSYTKKNGTVVRSYKRRPAGSKARSADVSSTPTASRDSNGKIKRSPAAKEAFERQSGYPHGRPGYVVDHIKPLACGGADDPSNMQWQSIADAKAKDKVERQDCR
jgi:hypothetical protein